MRNQILTTIAVAMITTACFSSGSRAITREIDEVVSDSLPRRVSLQAVPVSQAETLPSYGIKVRADKVVLKLQITAPRFENDDPFDDIQAAIDRISAEVAESEAVTLESISVGQVGGIVDRDGPASYIEELEASSATLKFVTDLSANDSDVIEELAAFDALLKAVDLPETLGVQVLSFETEVTDTEVYRQQLITRIYQEVAAIEEEYGQPVDFQITGLHSNIQVRQLSDVEYYLYLEPAIVVTQF